MSKLLRWIPALLVMSIIFIISATPAAELPVYGVLDTLVKKGGHMAGYALLGLCFWYALGFEMRSVWRAWLLALIYAASDEFHQSFTPGRHPSVLDVFVFDGGGAALSLLAGAWLKHIRAAR